MKDVKKQLDVLGDFWSYFLVIKTSQMRTGHETFTKDEVLQKKNIWQ